MQNLMADAELKIVDFRFVSRMSEDTEYAERRCKAFAGSICSPRPIRAPFAQCLWHRLVRL